jgi:hypothetical protein
MANSATLLEAVANFDLLPENAIVSAKVARAVLGDVLTERTLRRSPPIPRRQLTERKFGFRVGDLRALIRGEQAPEAA